MARIFSKASILDGYIMHQTSRYCTFSEQTPRSSGLPLPPALEVFIDSCSLLGLAKDTCSNSIHVQVCLFNAGKVRGICRVFVHNI